MKILLLEDDLALSGVIKEELMHNGYTVDCCSDGECGILYALNTDFAYDAAIIDRMLPVVDGLTIIKAMRRKGIRIPIIITTAMSDLNDRIEGLDGGADDYLVKPFHIKELMARVRALIRRPAELIEAEVYTYEDLSFDSENRCLKTSVKEVILTAKESALLAVLMQNAGKLFRREQLILKIWGTTSEVESGNVDNYISFLRKRLKELNSRCEIKTVYGAGYKLEKKDAESII